MQKIIKALLGIAIGLSMFINASSAPGQSSISADTITGINLPLPKSAEDKAYLGLPDKGLFTIPQIRAEVVIIEIFSMYCPRCQAEAARVNELYRLISKDPGLKGKIKMIGIGAGNTPFEVDIFKQTYGIPFPLFSDEDFSAHKKLGEVRTPFFIGVKMGLDRSLSVFYTKLGGFQDPSQFLKLMLELSGLKEG